VSKFGRARREVVVHPDSDRETQRIPFLQLRDMVMALMEDDEDPAREFDVQPTTYRPQRRLDTIDALIEALPKY
jgi:Fe-S-cluster formation regulator IscX/YfhJ